ncbi:MAG: hypothetical protein HYT63_02065, partial [Candidatus Yanofskybacteria bacterium]|nr:hypothetical protein [Candidatus Yanofskybacteria bacterium]
DYFPWKYLPILPILASPLVKLFSFKFFYFFYVTSIQVLVLTLGLILITKVGIILKRENWQIILAVGLYWIFWGTQADWRMGQYNTLAGLFFLISFWGVASQKKGFSIFGWLASIISKPIFIFGFFYFLKKKNWQAIIWFLAIIAITLIYLEKFLLSGGLLSAYQASFGFLTDPSRINWQVHYIDNLGPAALLGELFYDRFPDIYKWSVMALASIAVIIPTICLFTKENRKKELYFFLLLALSPFIFYREIWESLLAFLAPIVALVFLLSNTKREKIFTFLIWFFLATPTLYFFWQNSKTATLMTALITEKALPILVLYAYLVIKIFSKQTSQLENSKR